MHRCHDYRGNDGEPLVRDWIECFVGILRRDKATVTWRTRDEKELRRRVSIKLVGCNVPPGFVDFVLTDRGWQALNSKAVNNIIPVDPDEGLREPRHG